MIILLFLAVIGLIVALAWLHGRTVLLEQRLDALEGRALAPIVEAEAEPEPAPAEPPIQPEPAAPRGPARIAYATQAAAPPPSVAPAEAGAAGVVAHPAPPPRPEAPAAAGATSTSPLAQSKTLSETFESLVGGRLPIWIGGAALVLAAFFLVRYSIENGLLGPQARAILAAIFGLILIAVSEAARRLPQTADDPRVGQALAGAGIASLYGTLYMAGELYGLIGGLTAFMLMLLVTAAALGLSLRHGPPTAIMGLIGGFAAPLVTGYSETNLVPLLIYLALFTAALFGLAIARGWAWLALAAGGAGFAWSAWLIAAIDGSAANAIGPFILILALGATFAHPRLQRPLPFRGEGQAAQRRGERGSDALIRIAPLLLGMVQLVMLAPRLDFGPLAWGLYALLAAATVFLALRDPRLLPAAGASLALVLVMLALGLANNAATAPYAALGFALLFTATGHALMGRTEGRRTWTLSALGGSAAIYLLTRTLTDLDLSDTVWALLALAAAASCAAVAWRVRNLLPPSPSGVSGRSGSQPDLNDAGHRSPETGPGEGPVNKSYEPLGHRSAPALTALLIAIGLAPLAGAAWTPALLAGLMLALAAWARHTASPALFTLPAIAFAAALLAAWEPGFDYANLVLNSLTGARTPYLLLPSLADALRQLALPALAAVGLLATDPRQFGRARAPVTVAAAAVAAMLAYHLAKLPLAIATDARFLALGFIERALLTHALFAAALILARWPAWRPLAASVAAFALARIVWFDLGILNPVLVAQQVGSIPLLNAAVLHAAATALWLWLLARILPAPKVWRGLSLAAVLLTALTIVRQATHGTLLTRRPFGMEQSGQAETWLYSAAMLAVAIAWLARGIHTGARDLRITGLALLTVVTLKVFLIDAAALAGILRILSFLGLGLALIAIGWAYGKVLRRPVADPTIPT